MKSGNLNFLEPSGPLQACNGTAFPLPLHAPTPLHHHHHHHHVPKNQTYDDPMESKHVALRMFYIVVFDIYLCIIHYVVSSQHIRMVNLHSDLGVTKST